MVVTRELGSSKPITVEFRIVGPDNSYNYIVGLYKGKKRVNHWRIDEVPSGKTEKLIVKTNSLGLGEYGLYIWAQLTKDKDESPEESDKEPNSLKITKAHVEKIQIVQGKDDDSKKKGPEDKGDEGKDRKKKREEESTSETLLALAKAIQELKVGKGFLVKRFSKPNQLIADLEDEKDLVRELKRLSDYWDLSLINHKKLIDNTEEIRSGKHSPKEEKELASDILTECNLIAKDHDDIKEVLEKIHKILKEKEKKPFLKQKLIALEEILVKIEENEARLKKIDDNVGDDEAKLVEYIKE